MQCWSPMRPMPSWAAAWTFCPPPRCGLRRISAWPSWCTADLSGPLRCSLTATTGRCSRSVNECSARARRLRTSCSTRSSPRTAISCAPSHRPRCARGYLRSLATVACRSYVPAAVTSAAWTMRRPGHPRPGSTSPRARNWAPSSPTSRGCRTTSTSRSCSACSTMSPTTRSRGSSAARARRSRRSCFRPDPRSQSPESRAKRPAPDIREQLGSPACRGSALLRATLRHHVRIAQIAARFASTRADSARALALLPAALAVWLRACRFQVAARRVRWRTRRRRHHRRAQRRRLGSDRARSPDNPNSCRHNRHHHIARGPGNAAHAREARSGARSARARRTRKVRAATTRGRPATSNHDYATHGTSRTAPGLFDDRQRRIPARASAQPRRSGIAPASPLTGTSSPSGAREQEPRASNTAPASPAAPPAPTSPSGARQDRPTDAPTAPAAPAFPVSLSSRENAARQPPAAPTVPPAPAPTLSPSSPSTARQQPPATTPTAPSPPGPPPTPATTGNSRQRRPQSRVRHRRRVRHHRRRPRDNNRPSRAPSRPRPRPRIRHHRRRSRIHNKRPARAPSPRPGTVHVAVIVDERATTRPAGRGQPPSPGDFAGHDTRTTDNAGAGATDADEPTVTRAAGTRCIGRSCAIHSDVTAVNRAASRVAGSRERATTRPAGRGQPPSPGDFAGHDTRTTDDAGAGATDADQRQSPAPPARAELAARAPSTPTSPPSTGHRHESPAPATAPAAAASAPRPPSPSTTAHEPPPVATTAAGAPQPHRPTASAPSTQAPPPPTPSIAPPHEPAHAPTALTPPAQPSHPAPTQDTAAAGTQPAPHGTQGHQPPAAERE